MCKKKVISPEAVELGKKIHLLRIQRGLTLEQLAELVEIKKSVLIDIEHGRENVTCYNLEKIFYALGHKD